MSKKTKFKSRISKLLLGMVFAFSVPVLAIAQQQMEYEVKQGETLYSISKKLEVNVAELKQWNGLEGNNLAIGQILIYYKLEETTDEASDTGVPSETLINKQQIPENDFYTVKSGDNLYTISRNHNMTVEELKALNDLESNVIRVGQQLAVRKLSSGPSVSLSTDESTSQGLFSLYTVSEGESLDSILTKFKMSENEFGQLNPQINIQSLFRGQEVTVLVPPSNEFENPYLQNANLEDLGTVPVIVYDDSEIARTTTNGELYDPEALTAAHANIRLGTVIFVENPATGKGIYVRINDRITGDGIKLSARAFKSLGFKQNENVSVNIYLES